MAFEINKFPRNRLNEEAITKCWELLKKAIRMIDQERAYQLSYEELYRNGYYIVQNKKGELLYKNVSATISEIIHQIFEQLVDTQDQYLLVEISRQWDKHKRTMSMIKDILMYMNHNYCPKVGKPLINDHGYDLFLKQLLLRQPIISRFQSSLLDMYLRARNVPGNTNFNALAQSIKMLLELDIFGGRKEVYEKLFEREFLHNSRILFHQECGDYITQHSISDYLLFCEKRLKEELTLCNRLLYSGTYEKLKLIYLQESIEKHVSTLIKREQGQQNLSAMYASAAHNESVLPLAETEEQTGNGGFIMFLKESKLQEIKRMHTLFSQAPPLCNKALIDAMIHTISKSGEEIVQDEKLEAHNFTMALFALDEKYNEIVTMACNNDSNFRLAKKKAFQQFLNQSDKTARALARYTDFLFRRQVRQLTDQQLEQKINSTIRIFSNLSDKDIFQGFYRKALAKRLITGRGLHSEGERMMIARLKAECGPIFTKKLEVMLSDLQASDDFLREFKQSRISKQIQNIEFSMKVLTGGNWPLDNQKSEVVVPKSIMTVMDVFTQFYLNKFAGRALNWKLSEGTADLRMIVGDQTKHELTVSTLQMCALLLFNQKQAFSTGELAAILNISMREVEQIVVPLTNLKLLIKEQAPTGGSGSTLLPLGKQGEEVKENQILKLNGHFSNRQYKLRVPLYIPKEEAESQKVEAVQRVLEDRGPVMDSVIVRIMKSRRQLHHNDLMSEVIKMLSYRFQPDPASIKKRIEALIDRDFIERDSKDVRLYNYLA